MPKKRRLFRRDSDEQVERLKREKLLPHYKLEVIEGALNEQGETISVYIKRILSGKKVSKQYFFQQGLDRIVQEV